MGVSPMQCGLESSVLESAWTAAVLRYDILPIPTTGKMPVGLMGETPMLR